MSDSTTNIPSEQPLLDLQHLQMLEDLSDSEESLVQELATIFKSSTPQLLNQLSVAISADDRDTICKVAHRLKGSAANIGARKMAAQCSELEHQAKSPDAKISTTDLSLLCDNFNASEQALSQWLSNH